MDCGGSLRRFADCLRGAPSCGRFLEEQWIKKSWVGSSGVHCWVWESVAQPFALMES